MILVGASGGDAGRDGGAAAVRTPACEPLCRSNRCHPLPGGGVAGEDGPCRNAAARMAGVEATIGMGPPIRPPG